MYQPNDIPPDGNRVLIAEADPMAARLIGLILSKAGWNVDTAHDVQTALAIMDCRRHAVLICDVHLNGWYGLETARSCLTLNPRLKVVMVSTENDHLRQARAEGFLLQVKKPFDARAMRSIVGEPLEAARSQPGDHCPASETVADIPPNWMPIPAINTL